MSKQIQCATVQEIITIALLPWMEIACDIACINVLDTIQGDIDLHEFVRLVPSWRKEKICR